MKNIDVPDIRALIGLTFFIIQAILTNIIEIINIVRTVPTFMVEFVISKISIGNKVVSIMNKKLIKITIKNKIECII